jgi:hypothetical protein
MTVLHHACLSMSYSSITSIIMALADSSIEKAQVVASGPHALAYDNINISTSIFVEQVPGMMSKVQSGTFSVIYELLNDNPEHMKIQPLMENLRNSLPLVLSDVCMSFPASCSYISQSTITILQILFKYVEGFDYVNDNPTFQHPSLRTIPKGHKTKFHPLRTTTIEEATVTGNLLVHDNVYKVQLGKNGSDLVEHAIPSFNDQLTNARI